MSEEGWKGYRCLDCDRAMPRQSGWPGGDPVLDDDEYDLTTCAGYPSLEDTDRREGECVSFGYVLAGFQAVGLMPRELGTIQTFLQEHIGHRIESPIAVSDNTAPSPARATLAGVPRWRRPTRPRFIGTEYEWSVYVIGCPRDPGVYDSKACHEIRPLRQMTLTPANVDLFLERVLAHVDTSLRGFHPFRRNSLRTLGDFLRKHRMHEPLVIVEGPGGTR